MKQTFYTFIACCLIYSQCFAVSLIGSGIVVSGGSCDTVLSSNTSENTADFWNATTTEGQEYQKVKNSTSATICKITLRLQYVTQAEDMKVSVWSVDGNQDPDTQLGDDSDSTNIGSSSYTEYDFTWSGTKPSVTGDFAVTWWESSDGAGVIQYRAYYIDGNGNDYPDGTADDAIYHVVANGVDRTQDAYIIIYYE